MQHFVCVRDNGFEVVVRYVAFGIVCCCLRVWFGFYFRVALFNVLLSATCNGIVCCFCVLVWIFISCGIL